MYDASRTNTFGQWALYETQSMTRRICLQDRTLIWNPGPVALSLIPKVWDWGPVNGPGPNSVEGQSTGPHSRIGLLHRWPGSYPRLLATQALERAEQGLYYLESQVADTNGPLLIESGQNYPLAFQVGFAECHYAFLGPQGMIGVWL